MIFAGGTAATALPHSIVTCGGKLHVAMTILLCMVTHSHWRETWPTEHDMTMDPYSYASSHSNRATFMDGILSTPCSSFCFNWCFSHIWSLFTSILPMPQITFYLCIRPTILISGFVVDLGYFEMHMVVSSCIPFLQYMDKQFCPHT